MITSKQNALIKEIRALSDKKFRDRLGVFVIEGVKPVKEAIELGISIREVVCTEKGLLSLGTCSAKTELVTEEVFKYISEETTPQGVLAIGVKPQNNLSAPCGNCLFLDGVSDPANVGAIIRTAAAAGYNEIYMSPECADPYSQKAVRASMSGVFRVKIMRDTVKNILSVINLPIWVADMGGQSVYLAKNNGSFCLVIGSEGHGACKEVRERADFTVSIPMENGVESLNAAVSAGILMYSLKN